MSYYIIKESSKKFSTKRKIEAISKIKERVNPPKDKKDDKYSIFFKNLFKEYNKPIGLINSISIEFDSDLEVSAQTINGSIKLNEKLLEKQFSTMMRYVVHELVHVFQHMDGLKDDGKKKNYLDNKDEVEAFQKQIEFDANNKGIDKALDYTKKLLKFHKYPKKKRKDKIMELTEGVENVENTNNANKPGVKRD